MAPYDALYEPEYQKDVYIDTVSSKDPAAYPDNGEQDGYWYVKI